MINEKRLTDTFMELVQIDSESGNERNICNKLYELFTSLGLQVVEDDTMEITGHGAGNLICTLEPSSEAYESADAIFFTCHMDTVTPGNGIKPRIDKDGYIRSDGTTILGSDDKAGIAAMLEAIEVCKANDLPHGRVLFVITVGEETSLAGASAMSNTQLPVKMGYALDSNGNVGSICTSAPTQAQIEINIYGKSAHAGVNPEDGISAIQVASKSISKMPLGRISKDTTANIGRFEGGQQTNIVCDHVRILAEARSLVPEQLTKQVAKMNEAFTSTAEQFGARADFQSDIIYHGFNHEDSSQVVQTAFQAMQRIGMKGSSFSSGGGSDANVFNALGIPTVNLAVGYEKIHTTEEHIHVDSLIDLTRVVVAIMEQVSKTS